MTDIPLTTSATSPPPRRDWRLTLLRAEASLHEAIRNLDASALQIALVVTADGHLVGTLTDGDIRRGLLRGLDLAMPIESIIFRTPFVVPPALGRDLVLELMQANHLRQLPIVDAEHRVVGLHLWDEITSPMQKPNRMVVMAGGKGTRLRPFTENCPKPLLPVAGKPMLEHILLRAKAEGFQHFTFAIHYLGHMIEDYFGHGERWQVEIDYLREESPIGTAGALRLLSPRPDQPFLISNGDVLTDVNYGELLDFNLRYDSAATMAVRPHELQHPFGVVHTNGIDLIGFEEKPVFRTHVNAGIYVLNPSALDALPIEGPCDMPMLFERLKEKGHRTTVYPMHEPWLDVGRPEDYETAQNLGVKQ